MNPFPCLVRSVSPSGEPRYALGEPLVDGYLEFVAGRCRANTVRAVAFDLKMFFSVVNEVPVAVRPVHVFEFLAQQRGDRTVVRLVDRESGLSARTIARRLSSVSGFYAYLVARGDTPVTVNPVPRGLQTRRAGGRARTVPLVRVPQTLPKILSPAEVDALLGALRTARDRAMVLAMLLGGLRRCEVLGLCLADVRVADRAVFVADGKGGHQRLTPIANAFFTALGDYLRSERPAGIDTDRVFVVLKQPRRGRPLAVRTPGGDRHRPCLRRAEAATAGSTVDDRRARRDPHRRTTSGRARARHLPSAAPHLLDPAARGGHGVGGGAGAGRTPLDRVDS